MRILVINPNASREMSDVIRDQLRAVARADVELEVGNPDGAPPAIESAQDEVQAVPPMLELVRSAEEHGIDAVVIACFSDPGLDAAREATSLPIVGIQEAAMHLAAQLGHRFSILTTLDLAETLVDLGLAQSNARLYANPTRAPGALAAAAS